MREDRQTLMLAHLSQLLDLITGFGGFIVPLIIWATNKDKIYDMDEQGKGIINFQLSILLYTIIIGCMTIPMFLFGVLNSVDFPEFWNTYDFDFHLSMHDSFNVILFTIISGLLLVSAFIFEIVFIIIATSKANQGQPYKYPITINFLK